MKVNVQVEIAVRDKWRCGEDCPFLHWFWFRCRLFKSGLNWDANERSLRCAACLRATGDTK